MFVCCICKNSESCDVKQLFKHFKEVHFLFDRYAKYVCCQGSCSRMYTDKCIFSKHLLLKHSDCISVLSPSIQTPTIPSIDMLLEDCHDDTQNPASEPPACKRPNLDIKGLAAKYVGQCKASTGTLQQASLMAKSCNSLVNVIVSDIEDDALQLKQLCTTDEQQVLVNTMLQKLEL